ncbi:MAG: 2-phospho-L-lactate transferase [Solirubrobacteraceae bacterium]|nr:2-phospho-L-lactate transferase [Solirubrobacteraceae bacterium]
MTTSPVVVLAGGTGGAKLARGMADVVGDELVVVANTGDDIEIHGAYVSPDPDLCTFWLADRIDARGWGLDGDTFATMDGLRELGIDVWFNLGDRDLAFCLRRAELLRGGARLTDALAELTTALGVAARVLPMSDDSVRTEVQTGGAWVDLQRFLIQHRDAPVEDVRLEGINEAAPTPEVLDAISRARAIVVGPSNPVISIGPILALPGMREALRAAPAPVVAVSPIVGGHVLKGPTASFLEHAGHPVDATGIAAVYGDLLDGLVCDEPWAGELPALRCDTMLSSPDARRYVAEATLRFATELS